MLLSHSNSTPSEISVIRIIIRQVVLVALGLENRLYVENLSFRLHFNDSKTSFHQPVDTNSVIATDSIITVREFVRLSFATLGIEVEFCGRGELEKGVIIDIDEDRLNLLQINKENIKFGHTVVKVDDKYAVSVFENFLEQEAGVGYRIIEGYPISDVETFINDLVMFDLGIIKKST